MPRRGGNRAKRGREEFGRSPQTAEDSRRFLRSTTEVQGPLAGGRGYRILPAFATKVLGPSLPALILLSRRYANAEIAATLCADCAAGTYSVDAGVTSCVECAAGTASIAVAADKADACETCQAGKYANAATAASGCTGCGSGKFGAVVGSFSADDCQECPEGTGSMAGSSSCAAMACYTALLVDS